MKIRVKAWMIVNELGNPDVLLPGDGWMQSLAVYETRALARAAIDKSSGCVQRVIPVVISAAHGAR